MAEHAFLPLATDAYIADTQHLTNEEHGVYLRLLMFAWRSPGCSLPDDDKRLAIMVGVTPKKWSRLKPTVMAFFTLQDGVYVQKRLTRERDFVEQKREQNRAAGIASSRARSLKKNNQASTDAPTGEATERQRNTQRKSNPHTHTHTISDSVPESSPPEDKRSSPPQRGGATSFFCSEG